jgi:hypothetical protein
MIESLLYLYSSIPDIMLSVCMYVCKILSCTQRLSFKDSQENNEVSNSHIQHRLMVS